MNTSKTASYTKLRDGSWGVRKPRTPGAIAPVAGDTISVSKKSGETKVETIDRVVATFDDAWLIAIRSTSASSSAPPRKSYTRGKWTGCSCGSREDSYGDLIPSDRNCSSCEFDA
jgi:hypothetical protein